MILEPALGESRQHTLLSLYAVIGGDVQYEKQITIDTDYSIPNSLFVICEKRNPGVIKEIRLSKFGPVIFYG